jgi:hypothetical protein
VTPSGIEPVSVSHSSTEKADSGQESEALADMSTPPASGSTTPTSGDTTKRTRPFLGFPFTSSFLRARSVKAGNEQADTDEDDRRTIRSLSSNHGIADSADKLLVSNGNGHAVHESPAPAAEKIGS